MMLMNFTVRRLFLKRYLSLILPLPPKQASRTVGAGVKKTLNQHWQFGVGYEFAD